MSLTNFKLQRQNIANFHRIPRHGIPHNSAKFLLIPYSTVYGMYGSEKKVRNSVLTEKVEVHLILCDLN
jgi:hypothetical protein